MLIPPFAGDIGIVLSSGDTIAERYCAQLGGDDVKNDATMTKEGRARTGSLPVVATP
jgi:hypothetical protein